MSDSNKNRDDKDNKPDPFDFFKLDPGDKRQDTNSGGFKRPKIPFWAVVLIILAVLSMINLLFMSRNDDLIDFSVFRQYIEEGKITRVEIGPTYFTGYGVRRSPAESSPSVYSPSALFRQDPTIEKYRTAGMISQGFLDLLDEKGVTYSYVPRQNNYIFDFILTWILPFGFILLMWRFVFRRMGGGLGGSIFSTGQSKASAVEEGQVTTRFADVAGVDEAKEELVEVVDFLKSPQKYTEIGGKIPKGVLLVGPPGTGKTLLARAVAGEAGVPFFRISGSDFVEMFVGVGASRVRDLFKQAREKAPCIVFIDELDAIGKSRVNSINGNDEREQTLNQLLVEMDGFDNTTGLILLAATNRPDVLDPALLRPGRFDRQVVVDRPDIKGREAILKIHSRNVKLGSDVDLAAIAKTTPGFVGADLANVVNEAALLAVRSGRKVVNMVDFDEAMEKSIMGIQKKSRVIREEERRITAFHEAGHALAAAFTEGAHKVHKITIIPRGFAMGYVLNMPEDDHSHLTAKKILAEVDVCLGGRAAEEIVFKDVSTGASSDLMKATDSIRSMITDYGMSERFKNVVLSKRGGGYGSGEPQLVREYSEETQRYVDEQLAKIMEERYQRVVNLLSSKKVLMDYIANRLLDKEVIEEAEFYEIIEAEGSLETAPLETAPLETATPSSSGGPGEVIAPENASDL